MGKNRRPDCTLREAFEAVFYPMLGVGPETFQPLADQFYSQVFPTLSHLTGRIHRLWPWSKPAWRAATVWRSPPTNVPQHCRVTTAGLGRSAGRCVSF